MWSKILKWCHDSEVIVFARLQILGAAILATFAAFDFSTLAGTPTWKQYLFAGILFSQGVVTEVARKRRAEYDANGAIK